MQVFLRPALVALALAGCVPSFPALDVDGDGFDAASDCDDTNADVFPGAVDDCDGVDTDCDGLVDSDAAFDTWFVDIDGDEFGDVALSRRACVAPLGFVADSSDCDDLNAAVFPGAVEVCNGMDDDCDGLVDDADPDLLDSSRITFFRDVDEDGYGTDRTERACVAPVGFTALDGDCDDSNASISPDMVWYWDTDADGHGDPFATTQACERPDGAVALFDDCDDGESTVYPGASEVVGEGVDRDCDGVFVCFVDVDGDGWGDGEVSGSEGLACAGPAEARRSGDCDDVRDGVHPGAVEVCDGLDNDCDGDVDTSAEGETEWFRDTDDDGFGDPASGAVWACDAPEDYVVDATDCEPDEPTAYPGSHTTEVPLDGVDTDCDGLDVCTDLNCDGWPDVVFGWLEPWENQLYFGPDLSEEDSISVIPGLNHGSIPIGPVLDLNGDGRLDLVITGTSVVGNHWERLTKVYYGADPAIGSLFPEATSVQLAQNALAIAVGELVPTPNTPDGSQRPPSPDMVLSEGTPAIGETPENMFEGALAVIAVGPDYAPQDNIPLPGVGIGNACLGDVDRDGHTDVVVVGRRDLRVQDGGDAHDLDSFIVWGPEFLESEATALPVYWGFDCAIADLNGDEWPDIAFVHGVPNGTIYLNPQGRSGWTDVEAFERNQARSVRVATLSSGSAASLLLPSRLQPDGQTYGGIQGILTDPLGAAELGFVNDTPGVTYDMAVADFNMDGFADLVMSRTWGQVDLPDGGLDYNVPSLVYYGADGGFSDRNRAELDTYSALHLVVVPEWSAPGAGP